VGGLLLPPLVDFYVNKQTGFVHEAGRYTRYQFVRRGSNVKSTSDLQLYHPSDSDNPNHAVVLHKLSN
jgi:hypothetical protein